MKTTLAVPPKKRRRRVLPKVKLTPISLADIDDVMTLMTPEVTRNFQHFGDGVTREEELKFIRKIRRSKFDRVYSVFDEESGEYVGQVGINQISWENRLGRFALMIKSECQGRGYGEAAGREILRVAFDELRLQKIWLLVFASNKRSQRLYRRLGFRNQGLKRRHYFWRGEYHDMREMDQLDNEWRARFGTK